MKMRERFMAQSAVGRAAAAPAACPAPASAAAAGAAGRAGDGDLAAGHDAQLAIDDDLVAVMEVAGDRGIGAVVEQPP